MVYLIKYLYTTENCYLWHHANRHNVWFGYITSDIGAPQHEVQIKIKNHRA